MYKQIILYMGKTKIKRGQVTCLGPHTQLMAQPGVKPQTLSAWLFPLHYAARSH